MNNSFTDNNIIRNQLQMAQLEFSGFMFSTINLKLDILQRKREIDILFL